MDKKNNHVKKNTTAAKSHENAEKSNKEKLIEEPENVIDLYLREAAKGEKAEVASVAKLKKQLHLMDIKTLTAFFDEISLRIPQGGILHEEDPSKDLLLLQRLFTVYQGVFSIVYDKYLLDLYPITYEISAGLDLSQSPLFTTDPTVALYGYKEQSEGRTSLRPPLKPEMIKKIIQAEVNNGKSDLAQQWLYAIASYSKEHFRDPQFGAGFQTTRKELKNIIIENPSYLDLLTEYLKMNDGEKLLELFDVKNSLTLQNGELNGKIQEYQEREMQATEANRLLQDTLKMTKEENAALTIKMSEAELVKNQLEIASDRYHLQVRINEDLKRNQDRELEDIQTQLDELLDENHQQEETIEQLQNNITGLTNEKQNLESDLSTERNRTQMMRESSSIIEKNARKNITGDIVYLLSEPINHFTAYFKDFIKNEAFDALGLEICQADLEQLVSGLKAFDVSPIGNVDQIVPFERNLHTCEEKIENGENVRIIDMGWKIADNVILKATTEKVEG